MPRSCLQGPKYVHLVVRVRPTLHARRAGRTSKTRTTPKGDDAQDGEVGKDEPVLVVGYESGYDVGRAQWYADEPLSPASLVPGMKEMCVLMVCDGDGEGEERRRCDGLSVPMALLPTFTSK